MTKSRRRPGRPRLRIKAEVKHYNLGQKHIRAIERFRKTHGYSSASEALRGMIEDAKI